MINRLLGGPNLHTLLAQSNRPPVWEAAEHSALVGIADSGLDARLAVDVLSLKGGTLVETMSTALGQERIAELLAELLQRPRGGRFDVDDLTRLGDELGVDVLVDWLTARGMPGFLASDVSVVRIPDDDQGRPRYQLGVHVRNDEPTPGVASLDMPLASGFARSEIVRVSGQSSVEIGRVTPR